MVGLTSSEAEKRLQQYGPNALPEEKKSLFLLFLQKFWAPIPWLLEIIILLELILGKFTEMGVIGLLLLFNAALTLWQEDRAKNGLRLLQKKLEVQARVLRDGNWQRIPAEKLVPEDIIHIRMGDMIPADAKLLNGQILIDQSVITGESFPITSTIDQFLYAGSIVKHGEADALILATGKKTFFGKTAEIMRSTKTPSHLERMIFLIVKYLVAFDFLLLLALLAYAFSHGVAFAEIVPFSLLLLIASVPVALPATYTLSTTLGALELAKAGVLVTRLSAIEEAAGMNILCVDKTGTITKNSLQISSIDCSPPFTKEDLLSLAALASEEATQDPLDLAILAQAKGSLSPFSSAKRLQFMPFDPDKKYSEATIAYQQQEFQVLKGSPSELLQWIKDSSKTYEKDIKNFFSSGARTLAVILGNKNKFQWVGLIAMQDEPRENSKAAIREIQDLGIKMIMITGDEPATALSIAEKVHLGTHAFSRNDLSHLTKEELAKSDIIFHAFPEDKFQIISLLQQKGDLCGMTGDGVNDAPALKKAEVGIAVNNATDVAKAAASIVLTKPGLTDVVEAIKTSRRIYQRMLTYTMNKIIKTLEIAVLLSLGLMLTHQFIISQLLIVLLLFANDFMTMSIAAEAIVVKERSGAG